MKKISLFLLFLSYFSTFSQFKYDVSKNNPFGKYNPKAPKQIKDYAAFIGENKCISTSKRPDGSWAKPIGMVWRWKYIMNGTAIQDETLKEDGLHSGSIRLFNKDSLEWNVHYYSKNIISPLNFWKGKKTEDNRIILYMPQKAPNGADGFSRLTFYDIHEKGYKWIGEWVDKSEKIIFPFWKIECKR